MDPSWQPVLSAAQRRKQRRLRSWWRHEQQSIAAALATYSHHSALREQKTARAEEEDNEMHFTATFRANPPPQAAGTQYFAMDVDDVPAAGGSRPDRLHDVSGPQERVQRRTVQQIVDYPFFPVLDAPEPLMVGQVIEVPKIQSRRWSYRRFVDSLAIFRHPQTAEQLVEVPTIISFSSLQQTVEQNVDIPAVGGGGTGGGLSGFLPGQYYSMTAEQIVDNPVPRPGGVGDLQGFPRGQGSTALSEQIPEFPDPGGGHADFQPVQGSAASSSDSPGQAGQGVFRTFSPFQKKCEDPAHSVVRECPGSRAHGLHELSWRLVFGTTVDTWSASVPELMPYFSSFLREGELGS